MRVRNEGPHRRTTFDFNPAARWQRSLIHPARIFSLAGQAIFPLPPILAPIPPPCPPFPLLTQPPQLRDHVFPTPLMPLPFRVGAPRGTNQDITDVLQLDRVRPHSDRGARATPPPVPPLDSMMDFDANAWSDGMPAESCRLALSRHMQTSKV